MTRFVFQRTLRMVLVLLVISMITFAMMRAVPGGPFDTDRRLPPKVIEKLEEKYNLDDPYYVQYLDYVTGIVLPTVTSGEEQSKYLDHRYMISTPLPFGDQAVLRWVEFGPSYHSASRTVSDIFRDCLPVSMQLGSVALILAFVLGLPLGIVAALRRNTVVDYGAMGFSILGVSVPVIILGPVLQYVLGVESKWLPVTGWGGPEKLILPAFALGFPQSALIARLTRASLLQVLNQDHISEPGSLPGVGPVPGHVRLQLPGGWPARCTGPDAAGYGLVRQEVDV